MKTVGEVSREYGIPVSTINSAGEAGLIVIQPQEDGPRQIDEQSEQFASWIRDRMQQSRVKGASGLIGSLATYARTHGVRMSISWSRAQSDYVIVEPLNVLFSILDSCVDDLDFAQAASIGELARLTNVSMNVAAEYVGLFYQQIGGNRAAGSDVMRLLSRQQTIKSAYKILYRSAEKPENQEEPQGQQA
jgi:hypothetical protein